MPEAFTKAYHWAENHGVLGPILGMPRTEPSPKANCTTAVCRLPKVYQALGSSRSQAVGMAPAPIQASVKSRAPWLLPPSVSPKAMVLDEPSGMAPVLVRELE